MGRFANRIGGARLCIDGQTYELEKIDGQNTNHGGFSGFDRMLWDWEVWMKACTSRGFPRWRRRLSGQRAYHGGIPLER